MIKSKKGKIESCGLAVEYSARNQKIAGSIPIQC